jgi:hypothetical protein
VKNLLSKFLFKKAQETAETAMKEQGITVKHIEQEMNDAIVNGNRTQYLQKIRKTKHESSH